MGSASTHELLRAAGGRQPIRIILESPDIKVGKQFEWCQPFVLVGRHARSDLRLDNPAVSNRQLYVQLIDGKLFGVHLSNRVPTFWGHRALHCGWIEDGIDLKITWHSLRFLDAGNAPAANSVAINPLAAGTHRGPPVRLKLQNSSGGRTLVLDRTITLVGNAPICKLRINSSRVSSVHCSLVRTGGGLLVVDLASREGLRVNGAPIRAAILSAGDVLDIGGFRLEVSFEHPPPPPIEPTTTEEDVRVPFDPTELATRSDLTSPPIPPGAFLHSDEFIEAFGPVMDQFSAHQDQTFHQFQEMMATMVRAFGAMFTEHREFVKEELSRLDQLIRVLANERTESTPSVAPTPPLVRRDAPAAPDLSVPLPPLSPGQGGEQIHLWLQQRIGELGEKRASFWRQLARLLRTKTPSSAQE
jgi:pSer/pThr/pTyr-binding forkhead associated (FHA) protein